MRNGNLTYLVVGRVCNKHAAAITHEEDETWLAKSHFSSPAILFSRCTVPSQCVGDACRYIDHPNSVRPNFRHNNQTSCRPCYPNRRQEAGFCPIVEPCSPCSPSTSSQGSDHTRGYHNDTNSIVLRISNYQPRPVRAEGNAAWKAKTCVAARAVLKARQRIHKCDGAAGGNVHEPNPASTSCDVLADRHGNLRPGWIEGHATWGLKSGV